MNADQTNKIKQAQLSALLARLADKKPLTAAQLQYIADEFPTAAVAGSPTTSGEDVGDFIATSANDLAKRLGIHRQVIAYHKGRSGSPATLSVAEWKNYLSIMGKLPTAIKMEGANGSGSSAPFMEPMDADTAFAVMFDDLSSTMLTAVKFGLLTAGVKLSPRKVDQITWGIWIICAAKYQKLARSQGVQGPLDPVDDAGRCEYPPAIVSLAARIGKVMAAKQPTPAPTVEAKG